MRARRTIRNEGMGWGVWLGACVGALVILGVIGLMVYGGTIKAPRHHFEQVLPNDRFAS